jgi:hypothetical protein
LFAAIILVSFYLYQTQKEEEQTAKEEARVLFPVKVDQLRSLTLKREKETIRLEKTSADSDWSIVAPIRAATDRLALSRLLGTLAVLKSERLISESATDLSEFGLINPLVVSFREKRRGDPPLGGQSPMGTKLYATVGNSKSHLISATQNRNSKNPLRPEGKKSFP